MVATATRFAAKTEDSLVDLLLSRRDTMARCAEALRSEAAEALSQCDLSDLLDHENPAADSDSATTLALVHRAERRLREVETALDRVAAGTYGYCTICGEGIPLQRLRALPATTTCIDCCRSRSPDPPARRPSPNSIPANPKPGTHRPKCIIPEE
jgi:RNA polymerase-binding protein DksA